MEASGCKLRGHQKTLHEPGRLTFNALPVHWCSENIPSQPILQALANNHDSGRCVSGLIPQGCRPLALRLK